MKKYLLVIFNYVRMILLQWRCVCDCSIERIQLLSWKIKIHLKKNARVSFGTKIISEGAGSIFVDENAELKIGAHVYFNEGIIISSKKKVVIGDSSVFGPDVKIYDNNHKFSREFGVSATEYSADEVIIGKNCWIGANVIILKNTHVGDNCVIAAGSVIQGEIPESSIVKQDRTLVITPMR